MFNQIGQMASSMAYIHAAIPLNISTYQHHISLFELTLEKLTNAPVTAAQPIAKSIKDMAYFATKRLDKLTKKLRTIDNVLPDDDFSGQFNKRQKWFIDLLFAPAIVEQIKCAKNASLDGNMFSPIAHSKIIQHQCHFGQCHLHLLITKPARVDYFS